MTINDLYQIAAPEPVLRNVAGEGSISVQFEGHG
jgi:hypothetical protein